MLKTIIKPLIFILFFTQSLSTVALAQSAQELYQEGLGLFQKQQLSEAQDKWQQALKIEPDNPYILFNLGLVKFELEEWGWSLAYWKKAQFLKPGLDGVQLGMKKLETKLGKKLAVEQGFFSSSFSYFGFWPLLLFFSICFFTAIWLWLHYFEAKRLAREENSLSPSFPIKACVFSTAALTFIILSGLKLYLTFDETAVVVDKKAFARSTPSEKGTELFELPEGSQVTLRKTQGDWVQARLKGGLIGWVKNEQIFRIAGAPL